MNKKNIILFLLLFITIKLFSYDFNYNQILSIEVNDNIIKRIENDSDKYILIYLSELENPLLMQLNIKIKFTSNLFNDFGYSTLNIGNTLYKSDSNFNTGREPQINSRQFDIDYVVEKNTTLLLYNDTESKNAVLRIDFILGNGYEYKFFPINNSDYGKDNFLITIPENCWYYENGKLYIKANTHCKLLFYPKTRSFSIPGNTSYYNDILYINGKSYNSNISRSDFLVENNDLNILIEKGFPSIAPDGSKVEKKVFNKSISVDDVPPSKPIINAIEGNVNGNWTKENVTVQATESDDGSGSGINRYEYSTDNKSWQTGETYSTSVSDGEIYKGTVYFRAIDNVGNISETTSAEIQIDKKSPVIKANKAENVWTKGSLIINEISDEGSGIKQNTINGSPITGNEEIKADGIYTIKAVDKVGNTTTKKYYIDNTPPTITATKEDSLEYNDKGWTNQNVTVEITDAKSGVNDGTIGGVTATKSGNKYIGKLSGTGIYNITCSDVAGNPNSKEIKIDKVKPVSEWAQETYDGEEYREENGTKYLQSINVNYKVTDENSGIKESILKRGGSEINRETDKKEIKCKDDSIKDLDRSKDNILEYSIELTDNAGNPQEEIIKKTLTIPKEVQIRCVSEEEEKNNGGAGIKRTWIEEEYTKTGILINAIDFSKYRTIKIKRTFLGDMEEGKTERKEISYEDYKGYWEGTEESIIRGKWQEAQESIITKNDVREVEIAGVTYWYYEDKIRTDSGMGHRGIRYQSEWTWSNLAITEKGKYAEIEKTANKTGELKIRIEGTNKSGTEARYKYLDADGEETEIDEDFHVPVDGAVKIAVKVEDEDFDIYNIQGTEYVTADFSEGESIQITVAIEGCNTDGYIQKSQKGGKITTEYRKTEKNEDGWYEFDVPELKLYYNKPFNMKITMTEGCRGNNGKYKDVTESGLIALRTTNPDLGGFGLLVGKEAGYNKDGITARPHQRIDLKLEEKEEAGELSNIEWDFGDDTIKQNGNEGIYHKYGQSPERTGNTSEYMMTISCVQNQKQKAAAINVHIEDTQYGALLGDEEWIGKHPVTGKIQVPEGKTLSVRDNEKNPENPTEILGIGSAAEGNKGWIEVLSGGTFAAEGNSSNQKILMTEGKNGTEFTEVKTEKENGTDESLKWRGLTFRDGSKVYMKNAEVKYAETGITAERIGKCIQKENNFENAEIKNCSEAGMSAEGDIAAKGITVTGCKKGIYIKENVILTNSGTVAVKDSEEGMICNGTFSSGTVTLEGMKEKGITVKGRIDITEDMTIKGRGKIGLETETGSSVTMKNINVENFEKGIENRGTIEATKKVAVTECREYGIKNTGKISGETLEVKAGEGRENTTGIGYKAGEGSKTVFTETTIKATEIGVHCVGNANVTLGKCNINGVIYGVKTDRNSSGSPELKIKKGSTIESDTVKWYDWNDGVLTDQEIISKECN